MKQLLPNGARYLGTTGVPLKLTEGTWFDPDTVYDSLLLLPDSTNTATVWVGGQGVSVGRGFPLAPTLTTPVQLVGVSLGQIFVVGSAGDRVYFIASRRENEYG